MAIFEHTFTTMQITYTMKPCRDLSYNSVSRLSAWLEDIVGSHKKLIFINCMDKRSAQSAMMICRGANLPNQVSKWAKPN